MSDTDNPDKRSWLHDEISPNLVQLHHIKQVLYSGQTEYQSIEIIDTDSFGLCLVLDGKIQSSEKDEFIYHEALVHPCMLSHRNPERILIAGGGEGATIREVLVHNTVKQVTMVDIDSQVIDICRRFLPAIHQGAFDDPRVAIYYDDARKWIDETSEVFDVIIIDLVEPVEDSPAYLLYTQEFYKIVKQKLAPDGIMCVQSGAAGWTNHENFAAINHTLKSVFSIVSPFQIYVPSFVDMWGFHIASENNSPADMSAEEVDRKISKVLNRELKSYDGISHQALFALPRHLRNELARGKRIITDKDPIFVY
jgi:spermidine synthase